MYLQKYCLMKLNPVGYYKMQTGEVIDKLYVLGCVTKQDHVASAKRNHRHVGQYSDTLYISGESDIKRQTHQF